MQSKLWNRNFSLAVVGMVISALGGVGLNVAMGVLVFQETQSTALSAMFTALSFLPEFILPLIMGPIIDRNNPLKILVRNEVILAAVFFAVAGISYLIGFNYLMYLVFSLAIGCFGVISNLASNSVIPQIMSREHYVRGNAVISTIYPLCSVLVVPVAIKLFDAFGMPLILAIYGVACLIDATLESRINTKFEYRESRSFSLQEYIADLKDGFDYFRNDRGIRTVFVFFALVMFSSGSHTLFYPFFNRTEGLTNDHYALMDSIRSAGYMAGGLLHYFIKIPDSKRYRIAVTVYVCFAVVDGAFFLMPFWLMCVSGFSLGIAGMNSANIRVSAVQSRVSNHYRAKVNAIFGIMTSVASMFGQMLAGSLGEFMPYWLVHILFNGLYLASTLIFILPRKNRVRELYNYSTRLEAGGEPAEGGAG